MATIDLNKITSGKDSVNGTGLFDVLMQALDANIQKQFDNGRITGKEFAHIWLGGMQTAMTQAVSFSLSEQQADKQAELLAEQVKSEIKNNEDAGVIDLQKQKTQEEIDLVVSQTANSYEKVDSSQQDTLRNNRIVEKQILKTDEEISLISAQTAEMLAGTTRQDSLASKQLEKIDEEVDLLQSRDSEQIAATLRQDNESTKKQLLMDAQTTGFYSDTKVKTLKQMYEGFSIGYSLSEEGDIPNAAYGASIDALTTNILDEISAPNIVVAGE